MTFMNNVLDNFIKFCFKNNITFSIKREGTLNLYVQNLESENKNITIFFSEIEPNIGLIEFYEELYVKYNELEEFFN